MDQVVEKQGIYSNGSIWPHCACVEMGPFAQRNCKEGDRKITDPKRFDIAMSQIVGKRLTYVDLTGKKRPPSNPFHRQRGAKQKAS